MAEPVISVAGLRKSYGDLEAVRGIDLEVAKGEIFAFLGPNGAGKTTTVEILEGYRGRTAGEVTVLGADPARADREWRERVGIVLQDSKMHPELTVRESLELFAGYYRSPRDVAGTIDLAGPVGEGRRSRRAALRRPAATARRGAGADRRPRAALPGRADDGLRPLGATPGVGGGGEPARARQDRVPDHALHGGGAGAGGPGGDHRRRPDRGAGLAGRARRPGRTPRRRISFRLPAGRQRRPAGEARGGGRQRGGSPGGGRPRPLSSTSSPPGRWSAGSRSRGWRSGGRAWRTCTWS